MATTRQAQVTWRGDLASGQGVLTGSSSQTFQNLGISWKSRAEAPNGMTSPEELLAAAHAGCFSMALAAGLAKGGHPPSELQVKCTVTFDPIAPKVRSSALEVRAKVPGLDAATFERAANEAKDDCPISRALQGNVSLELRAILEEMESHPAP